ncbi:MAG: hemerythrin domain-containing protein [Sandaracinaceae bacterium]|nr:hemerythrin domain-containing protein [Sandaracinaceae bacterium]
MTQPNLETGASEFFTADHARCDALWARVEELVDEGDDTQARAQWKAFDAAMRRHLAMEEEVVFPALDEATGMRGMGPVAVMKHEHAQMRTLLDRMGALAERGELGAMSDHGDSLMMLIQQHNAKEEGVLYPMMDAALGPAWPRLVTMLARY